MKAWAIVAVMAGVAHADITTDEPPTAAQLQRELGGHYARPERFKIEVVSQDQRWTNWRRIYDGVEMSLPIGTHYDGHQYVTRFMPERQPPPLVNRAKLLTPKAVRAIAGARDDATVTLIYKPWTDRDVIDHWYLAYVVGAGRLILTIEPYTGQLLGSVGTRIID